MIARQLFVLALGESSKTGKLLLIILFIIFLLNTQLSSLLLRIHKHKLRCC